MLGSERGRAGGDETQARKVGGFDRHRPVHKHRDSSRAADADRRTIRAEPLEVMALRELARQQQGCAAEQWSETAEFLCRDPVERAKLKHPIVGAELERLCD